MDKKCVLASIVTAYASKIYKGEKTIELRKTQPVDIDIWEPDGTFTVFLYESKTGCVTGKCVVNAIMRLLEWNEIIGRNSCLAKPLFDDYAKGNAIKGWCIKSATRFKTPIPIKEFGFDSPPQSWRYVTLNEKVLTVE